MHGSERSRRPADQLRVELTTSGTGAAALRADLRQILDDLTLGDRVRIDLD